MANIGTFKKVGNDYQGEILTMSVQTKNVRIIPEDSMANDNAPSHRVFVGRAEIGAAWAKRSSEGRDYLSVKLDDPSFTAPIFANLFDDEDGPAKPRPETRAGLFHAWRVEQSPMVGTISHRFPYPQIVALL